MPRHLIQDAHELVNEISTVRLTGLKPRRKKEVSFLPNSGLLVGLFVRCRIIGKGSFFAIPLLIELFW